MRIDPDAPSLTSRGLPRADQLNEALARLPVAIGQFRSAFDGMADAGHRLSRIMAKEHRRILRAAYRSGLLPWPTPTGCYPHRARWAGRAPQRRRRR